MSGTTTTGTRERCTTWYVAAPSNVPRHRDGRGVWDIPEPDPKRCPEVKFSDVDLALVPALAADRAGYRLGYGAGYFDKLLEGRGESPFCVVALPSQFIFPSLPHEEHDGRRRGLAAAARRRTRRRCSGCGRHGRPS